MAEAPLSLTANIANKTWQNGLTTKLGYGIIGLQIKLGKGALVMNKEEILKKAQAEKKDEREIQVKDKSMIWSYIVMVIAAGIFSLIRSQQGLPMMDLSATVSASVFAGMAYRFVKTKNKNNLIIAVIMLIVAIAATMRFFMGH